MVTATRKRTIAFIAFACTCGLGLRSASAEGPERTVAPQPLELWSKAGSGLGALELRCERAPRWAWRVQETIDPWAKPIPPCEARPSTQFDARAPEIVDPWPARRGEWASSHEIVDPWALEKKRPGGH
jgi:hypothetical protein